MGLEKGATGRSSMDPVSRTYDGGVVCVAVGRCVLIPARMTGRVVRALWDSVVWVLVERSQV